MADHAVGGLQDLPRRAVVGLEPDDRGALEVAREAEDLADVGAAPAVDRLVVVAHHAHVAVPARDLAHDLVLRVVGVLVLVDQHVAVALAVVRAHLGVLAQQAHRLEQQVVEVERAGARERLAVALEHRAHELVAGALALGQERLRRLHAVLGERDAREHGGGVHRGLVHAQLAHRLLHGAQLVGGVADGEAAVEADRLAALAQQPGAERVEGADGDLARPLAGERRDPLAHLARGLVGEGDGEDARRVHPERDEVRDPRRDHARLARARAREDQQRALGREHGLALLGVEALEQRARRRGAAAAGRQGRRGSACQKGVLIPRGPAPAPKVDSCADPSTRRCR